MRRSINFGNTIAVLGASALFLSSLEYMVPKPVPFIRIGLANLPILLSLSILPVPSVLLLVFIKVVGQGLIHGTLFSYVFLLSLSGSLSSALIMLCIHRLFSRRIVSLLGVSIAGATVSNAAQIVLSRYLFFGPGAWIIAPPILGIGIVSAILLGITAESFISQSSWYQQKRGENR